MSGETPQIRWPAARKMTLLSIATLTIMAGTTVAPALRAIEHAFGTVQHVELMSRMVLTLPAIFVVISAPFWGTLTDRYGRKKLLVGSIVLYAIAGMSGLFVDGMTALLIGRAALGLAIGGIMAISIALVGDYFEGTERERYLGLQQAFVQLGGVAFVIAGGLLADIHWRAPFAVYGAALVILVAAIAFLYEPARSEASVATASGGFFRFGRSMALICLAAFLLNAAFYTVPSQLPFYLPLLGQEQPSSAGLSIGVLNLAAAVMALNYGRLRGRIDNAAMFVIAFSLIAVGFWLLAAAGGFVAALIALVVMGLGLGLAMPSLMSVSIGQAAPMERGRVGGILTASMFLGHFVSPLASQPWVHLFGYANMYRDAGLLVGGMAALVLLARWQRRMLASERR